jgi:predicted DNA-binding transcriptional regulator AlpA
MAAALLTQDELSAETGIPARTLEYWRCYGGGPNYVKMGRRVGYRRADVDAWLKARAGQHGAGRRRRAGCR